MLRPIALIAGVYMIGFFIALCVFSSAFSANADDNVIFPDSDSVRIKGYKKIQPDEALNSWATDMQMGAFETGSSASTGSNWENLYLAFAIDARFKRDCYGSKTSSLCTFLRSSVALSGNLGWTDSRTAKRFDVILVPIEYVTGTFGKQGPEIKITNGALFATIGALGEYLHDLGLGIENRVLGFANTSLNYSSSQQPLGKSTSFRWIGSVRLFLGGSGTQVTASKVSGGITAGLETQIGLALDLAEGTVAFTNTTRHEGDWSLGSDLNTNVTSDRIELKFLHSICNEQDRGGCSTPRPVSFGGGVRYEYMTSSYNSSTVPNTSIDHNVHRVIFFAELARF